MDKKRQLWIDVVLAYVEAQHQPLPLDCHGRDLGERCGVRCADRVLEAFEREKRV